MNKTIAFLILIAITLLEGCMLQPGYREWDNMPAEYQLTPYIEMPPHIRYNPITPTYVFR